MLQIYENLFWISYLCIIKLRKKNMTLKGAKLTHI